MTGTHNIRFAELQEKYLETREGRYLGEMYLVCAELAANYIRKYARSRGLRLDTDTLAHDSASCLIDIYIRKPGFRVEPLSGYLYRCCNSTMWSDKTWNRRTVSLEDWTRASGEAAV
jgi:hypothetical protein